MQKMLNEKKQEENKNMNLTKGKQK